ncbi:MAG: 50S ribosomal protein L18 [Candidatus Omnitrophica bacterium 4484_213]|nr:50S ribosomal protein L18 [Candidatus Omnitrophota bacterium]OQX52991.1 MAG: 50S ribosomal protein L18 [Candidatus Omnitrophica bacterium 4484_213]
MKNKKEAGRIKRHRRVRKKVFGTAEVPRLCVHRSLRNIEAQLIDDINERTIFSLSTNSKELRQKLTHRGNIKAASLLGEIFAHEAQKRNLRKVVFDRGGYLYHGRVKAFAEGARRGGLIF